MATAAHVAMLWQAHWEAGAELGEGEGEQEDGSDDVAVGGDSLVVVVVQLLVLVFMQAKQDLKALKVV